MTDLSSNLTKNDIYQILKCLDLLGHIILDQSKWKFFVSPPTLYMFDHKHLRFFLVGSRSDHVLKPLNKHQNIEVSYELNRPNVKEWQCYVPTPTIVKFKDLNVLKEMKDLESIRIYDSFEIAHHLLLYVGSLSEFKKSYLSDEFKRIKIKELSEIDNYNYYDVESNKFMNFQLQSFSDLEEYNQRLIREDNIFGAPSFFLLLHEENNGNYYKILIDYYWGNFLSHHQVGIKNLISYSEEKSNLKIDDSLKLPKIYEKILISCSGQQYKIIKENQRFYRIYNTVKRNIWYEIKRKLEM